MSWTAGATIAIRAIVLRCAVSLAFAMLAAGCATTKLPLQRDEYYPADWPDISPLGAECEELGGSYANEGTVAGAGGDQQTILLSTIILSNAAGILGKDITKLTALNEAKALSLSVRIGEVDRITQAHFAFLEVSGPGDHSIAAVGWCSENTFVMRALRGGALVPGVAGFGQDTALLGKATDGSIIAQVKSYTAMAIFLIPVYKQAPHVWARFAPIKR